MCCDCSVWCYKLGQPGPVATGGGGSGGETILGSCLHRQRRPGELVPRGLVGEGSSHRLTLQGTGGGGAGRTPGGTSRRGSAPGAQGCHPSTPSPGWTQPGALESQAWRPWREPGSGQGGQWDTTVKSCGQRGLGLGPRWHGLEQAPNAAELELGKRREGPGRPEPCCPRRVLPPQSCPPSHPAGQRLSRAFRAVWQGPESHSLHCPRPPPLPLSSGVFRLTWTLLGSVSGLEELCSPWSHPVPWPASQSVPLPLGPVGSPHHWSSWPP